ncbi:uncharacterized protein LOC141685588 [Apium graveolens]|uniref:uncharacterized protein LOC141685588 n=1 Tax=Apium graveolens TaxID=4045 RepID=UPI003D791E9D
MCSSGGKIDQKINNGGEPYCFKVKGQNLHLLGSMLPADGESPKFCQVYIYDTKNELENRMDLIGGCRDEIDENIVEALMDMLNQHNELVRQFHTARERFKENEQDEFRLVLLSSQSGSGRPSIIGPTYEVGDEGFHTKIPLNKTKMSKSADINPDDNDFEKKHREYVSMKEYYCYKLMIRLSEGLTLHLSGHLWQQYVVDAFCAIKQYQLNWVTTHQTTIRSDLYTSIRDALRKGDHDPNYVGKSVVLPASFTVMHVIEFQKRGLPHMHMLIWLHPDSRPKIVAQIDALVSTEIPDKDTDLVGYAAVSNYMIHGPCRVDNNYSPRMVKGRCMRHFPKRFNGNTYIDDGGFPIYRRCNTGRSIKKKGVFLDNRFVIPFNRDFLVLFQCHINLEQSCLNEVNKYLDGRYFCASKATWRIFGFDVHSRWPSVDRLPIHLPGNNYVSFRTGTTLSEVVQQADSKRTKLEDWFEANKEFLAARDFTYAEFPTHFTWLPRECKWRPRQRGDFVGRLTEVHATGDDLLYLRMLLMRRKGCTSFDELRTVEGHVFESFKEECAAMGLLQNDSQWHEAMVENSHSSLAKQLREMFVNILAYCSISYPLFLWNAQWKCLSDDIILLKRKECRNGNLQLPYCDIQNFALTKIEKLLNGIEKSLKDFPIMPYPPEVFLYNSSNGLIAEETGYDTDKMKRQHDENYIKLNREQKEVYEAVVESVNSNKASSGIAAVLLDGGRTAHSRFHIPIIVDQCSVVGIKHSTDLTELLQNTSLIISDEAPMQHQHGIENVNKCLRDIIAPIDPSRSSRPFGGITIVFGGDYRQTLPVITKASKGETVGSTLNRSKLWDFYKVFTLRQNMRLHSGLSDKRNKIITEFSKWQLAIGDGKVYSITENPEDDGLSTIVKHVIGDDWSVPLQKYHFVSLKNFTNNVGNNYSHDGLDDSPLAASGRAFITNMPFSAIYVNPDIPEVEAMRNRYLQC